MAVGYAVDSFAWTTAQTAGTTITRSFSFTVKFIRVHINGRSESADALGRSNIRYGRGFAASNTARRCIAGFSLDAAAAGDTSGGLFDDSIVSVIDATTRVGALDINAAFTTDVVFVVDTQLTGGDVRVFVEAYGDTDITDVFVGHASMLSATGNESRTDVGFQGDYFEFMMKSALTTINSVQVTFVDSHGFAIPRVSKQGVWCGRSEDGSASSDTDRYLYNGECLAGIHSTLANLNRRASFVEALSNGFTINVLETAGASLVAYLVVRGGVWDAATITFQTDTTTQFSITGWPGTPRGISGFSHSIVQSTQDTVQTNHVYMTGMSSSATVRQTMAHHDDDGVGDMVCNTLVDYDEFLAQIGGASTMVLAADIVSFNSDGVTFIMDVAAPSAGWIAYVVGVMDSGQPYRKRVGGVPHAAHQPMRVW